MSLRTLRLRAIANFEGATAAIDAAYQRIRIYSADAEECMEDLHQELCEHYGLCGEFLTGALILWSPGTRARNPACITISMNTGQIASPSAVLVRRTAYALIQVFEQDADDRDFMERGGLRTAHRLKTEGRALLI